MLQQHGIVVAIASITWEFAVAWFVKRLGVEYYVGTRLEAEGTIIHVWPRDSSKEIPEADWPLSPAGMQQAQHLATQLPADVAVVTHGGPINIVYQLLKGLPWSNKNPTSRAGWRATFKVDHL